MREDMMLFWNNKENPLGSVDEVLEKFAKKEFQSPYRSTVALLSWLKHEPESVLTLLRELGSKDSVELFIEYKVPPQNGRGNASHTDLMVLSGDVAIAIEAKWTEPRYKTVKKWLEEGSSLENRNAVLGGWLKQLGIEKSEDANDLIYQMVHRAASACIAGKQNTQKAVVVYLLFISSDDTSSEKQLSDIRNDLQFLKKLVDPEVGLSFFLAAVPIRELEPFERIKPHKKGTEETGVEVKKSLQEQRLFDFGEIDLEAI
jgi:hypothetical protein